MFVLAMPGFCTGVGSAVDDAINRYYFRTYDRATTVIIWAGMFIGIACLAEGILLILWRRVFDWQESPTNEGK
jgi:hypothetical protein